MLTNRALLALVAAMLSWPVLAQELPPAVDELNPAPAANAPAKDAKTEQVEELPPLTNGVPVTGLMFVPPPMQRVFPRPIWTGLAPSLAMGETGDTALRFGWWYANNSGSLVKTGEFQDLSPSPFWEFDGLYSNGFQTLGIYGNQTDNESNQASIQYFSPNWSAKMDFQRFIHRLDHIPLDNFLPDNAQSAKLPNSTYVVGQDLNVGEDYAIRVEQLRGSISDRINDNLRLRVDLWQQRKFGERQGNATAHCFQAQASNPNQRGCHVLSQSQHIDWLTVEVTPRLEARFGPVTIEYSRPMLQFTQDDELIFRDYQGRGSMIKGNYPYAIVPDTTTQIDQLKGAIDLGPTRRFYAFGYLGNTENHYRDTQRDFNGYDIRLTDWTLPRTSVTVYARSYNQTGNLPPSLVTGETATGPNGESQPLPKTTPETPPDQYISFPLEYHRTTGGIKANWRPDIYGYAFMNLVFTGGYEYDYLDRDNAVWQTPPRGPAAGALEASGKAVVSQANTTTQTIFVGANKPWRYSGDGFFDTYTRYKVLFVENPLYGVRQLNGVVNSNLPEQKHIVEFGGGWYPAPNFAVMVQQDIQVGRNHYDNTAIAAGNIVDFREQAYSTILSSWYAPTPKLSLVASVARLSNWINQNIFLGDNYVDPDDLPPDPTANLPLATQPTFYAGTSDLFNLNLQYKLTANVRLICGYQFVRGNNQFNMNADPSFAFPPSLSTKEPPGNIVFSDLPQYSAVVVETNKITAGITWQPQSQMTIYCNYNFFDFDDKTNDYNSGTAHMVMAGLSRIW